MNTEHTITPTPVTSNSEQLAVLKQHFPHCFDKQGQFVLSRFEEVLQAHEVATTQESYKLDWLGKSYARLLANEPIRTLLSADVAHNSQAANLNSQNLLIKGDNLEVLKHLKGAYREAVKMIYIDPPYNTGSDGFVYQDDRKFTPEQLADLANVTLEEAKRILDFTQRGANSHSAWLTFMYPRLYVAKQLLRDDGVIFISIDDNEQAQLKLLCDEVFGEGNFVACLPVVMNLKGNQDNFGFSDTHEYSFVYAKNKEFCHLGVFNIDEDTVLAEWEKDEYGLFKRADTLRRTGQDASRQNRPKGFFPIFIQHQTNTIYVTTDDKPLAAEDIALLPINDEGEELSWSWQKSKILAETYNLILVNGRKGINIYKKQRPQLGDLPTKKPKSLFYKPDYSTSTSTTNLKNLMDKKIFEAPKPIPFIKDLIQIGTTTNSIILDFFAGSGTTAHAVMQLNAEDGGNRQFICVQLDEKTDPKKEAYKAGYKSIFDITQARIQKAAQKIQTDNPNYTGDLGFKLFKTVPIFDNYQQPIAQFDPNQELFDGTQLSPQDLANLLTTWQLQHNIVMVYKTGHFER